jgi:hypothetical protein
VNTFRIILSTVLLAVGLAGCLPASAPLAPLPTDTFLPPTQTATPTIVWFPPTATFTPPPVGTSKPPPTQLPPIEHGELLFEDNFEAESSWALGKSFAGSAALGQNELSLVVTQPRGYLYSLRQETQLESYYLEITASPSICRGEDEYGLLLRVQGSSDFYRFALSCNGQASVDRLVQDQATSAQAPTSNGAIPPGAPSLTRLGVWSQGQELRFYANDQFLFSIRDTLLLSGGLGIFARAAGDDPVTVNFSKLAVYTLK